MHGLLGWRLPLPREIALFPVRSREPRVKLIGSFLTADVCFYSVFTAWKLYQACNNTTLCLNAGVICGLLTQQYSVVNDDQKATQSNSVVREFHQDVFSDVVSTKISAIPFMHQSGWTFTLYRSLLPWRSCESAHFPSLCPGFDSWTRRHIWVEFVFGSLHCSERFFSGYSGFPLSTIIQRFRIPILVWKVSIF